MDRVALPVGARLRWRGPALTLLGGLLLVGALALGGGAALWPWALSRLARWPWQICALGLLYIAPGLALLRLLWPRAQALSTSLRLALAPGLSVALPPLLLLLFQLLRLPWGAWTTWGYLLLCVAIEARAWIADLRAGRSSHSQLHTASTAAPGLVLLGITLAALLLRLYAVRDLPVGLLGDSYHHTLIAQLLVENRGIFHSWQPYAPLATFTYHFGFHANAAFVHYIAGIDIPQSVVWTGQILNAITLPLIFALALALGASAWAGAWAALLLGFVSPLPAYFVNWGRYTQLAGQVVLMAVVVCWIRLAHSAKNHRLQTNIAVPPTRLRSFMAHQNLLQGWRVILLSALATAAMILTHYLVTALAGAFVASYLLALLLARRDWRHGAALAVRAALALLLALLLASPWLINLAGGYLLRNAGGLVANSGNAAVAIVVVQHSTLESVTPKYASGAILLGALAGLLLALWRRDWRGALPALWCALLVLIVAPYLVGMRGAGVIDALTGEGTLYIPLALLAGSALAAAQQGLMVRLARWGASQAASFVLAGLLALTLIAGNAGWQAHVVEGDTALVVDADMAAMQWIREHTAPDARFLVNSFPAYGGTLAAGSDAGWWLPLLAGRTTTLPPLTYGSELGERRGYAAQVNALVKKLRGRALTDLAPVSIDLTRPVALKTLADNQIDYVYIGAHASPGPAAADHIDPAKLRASAAFRLVYERDGVEIFQFLKGIP